MSQAQKTETQPIEELRVLRARVEELEHAEADRRRAEEALRIQRDLGIALSLTGNLPETLDRLLEAALRVDGIDCGGVYLVDQETGALSLVSHIGLSPQFVVGVSHYTPGSPEARLIAAGKPVYRPHPELAPATQELLRREGLLSLAVVPVHCEGKVAAAMNLASHTHDEIPIGSRNALEAIAAQIGGVVARVRVAAALRERERFLSNIFASIQDGISILDDELNITQVNATMERWYSHSMPLTGKKCYEAYHERSAPCEVCPTQRTLQTCRAAYEVVPKRGPGGEITGWLDLYSFPLLDTTTGQLKGVIEYVRDITQRKRVEEAQRDQHNLLRSIIEGTSDGIFVKDVEGRYVLMNSSDAKGFAKPMEEIIGSTDKDLFPPEQAERIMEIDREIVASREAKNYEQDFEVSDAGVRTYLICKYPRFDQNGKVIGVIGIARDITERKRVEEELASYRDHLEEQVQTRTAELETSQERLQHAERLASVGTLAAGIAHQINNPVGMILLAAQNGRESLAKPDPERFAERCFEDIIRESERCSRIVKSVLQFAGRAPAEKRMSDLNEIISTAVQLSREYALDRGVVLERGPGCDSLPAMMDPAGMEQVVENLIRNAVEACDAGGRVEIRADRLSDRVRLVVEDDGRGIPKEQQKRLFDPFYTTRQREGGAGLGLSIVHGIVAWHGGSITVKSQRERGTKACVELPVGNEAPPKRE